VIGMPTKTPKSAHRGRSRQISDADYDVGYGRPPQHSRFKPGESGNPKGRASQSRNMKTILAKVLDEPVQMKVGGQLKRVSTMEAAVRVVVTRVFKGDPKGVAAFFVLLKQSGYGTEQAENSPELLVGVDHEEVLREFLGRATLKDLTEAETPSEEPTQEPKSSKEGRAR
jgi:hypothetical protein